MRTIAVTSQKGGSGKTTITGHLAVVAERMKCGPVAIIDTDPQGSLSEWWNERQAKTPLFAKASLATLGDDLQRLKDTGIKLVFIDTPPAITRANQTVIAKADMVIIPTRPSPHDLRAVGATIDLVEAAKKPMLFTINGATMRAKLTGEAAIVLSQHGTVAPSILHNRQEFAASMIDGRTVVETNPGGKSSKEIEELWQYIEARLKKLPVKASFKTTNHHRMNGFGKRPAVHPDPHHAQ